jgi:hypothetical protein
MIADGRLYPGAGLLANAYQQRTASRPTALSASATASRTTSAARRRWVVELYSS